MAANLLPAWTVRAAVDYKNVMVSKFEMVSGTNHASIGILAVVVAIVSLSVSDSQTVYIVVILDLRSIPILAACLMWHLPLKAAAFP